MKVKSKTVPNLYIRDLKIRFIDGVADVDDPKKIKTLEKMKDKGFEFEFENETSRESGRKGTKNE